MAVPENVTMNADIETRAREITFVSSFSDTFQSFMDILGVTRMISKPAGTQLVSKYAEVTLQDGNVAEGEEIPRSKASVKTKDYEKIKIEKFSKGVTLEAVDGHGYNDSILMTDQQFSFELLSNIASRFYTFLNTGTLNSSKGDFQAALAEAQGQVRNKWKKMKKGITDVVGFCNILDAYDYLGVAQIDAQTQFGMNYIENFIGYRRLFLCSEDEVAKGKVLATPVNNMICYHVNPADSDYARAGLVYTVDSRTNLIGFHTEANYRRAISETYALMGITLMAEYLDGIANVTFGTGA